MSHNQLELSWYHLLFPNNNHDEYLPLPPSILDFLCQYLSIDLDKSKVSNIRYQQLILSSMSRVKCETVNIYPTKADESKILWFLTCNTKAWNRTNIRLCWSFFTAQLRSSHCLIKRYGTIDEDKRYILSPIMIYLLFTRYKSEGQTLTDYMRVQELIRGPILSHEMYHSSDDVRVWNLPYLDTDSLKILSSTFSPKQMTICELVNLMEGRVFYSSPIYPLLLSETILTHKSLSTTTDLVFYGSPEGLFPISGQDLASLIKSKGFVDPLTMKPLDLMSQERLINILKRVGITVDSPRQQAEITDKDRIKIGSTLTSIYFQLKMSEPGTEENLVLNQLLSLSLNEKCSLISLMNFQARLYPMTMTLSEKINNILGKPDEISSCVRSSSIYFLYTGYHLLEKAKKKPSYSIDEALKGVKV